MKPEQLIAGLRAPSAPQWLKSAWTGAEKRGAGSLTFDDVQAEIDRHQGFEVLAPESEPDKSA